MKIHHFKKGVGLNPLKKNKSVPNGLKNPRTLKRGWSYPLKKK
jgi:hypothetical protein